MRLLASVETVGFNFVSRSLTYAGLQCRVWLVFGRVSPGCSVWRGSWLMAIAPRWWWSLFIGLPPGQGTVERAARLGVAGPSPARLETRTKESMGRASRRVFLAKPQEDAARPAGGGCFRVPPRPSRGVAYDAW